MSGAKVHHVLKLLRQTANFAEAAVPTASATTSTLPQSDWKGFSENMKAPAAAPLNAPGPSTYGIRAPVAVGQATNAAWSTPRRALPAPSTLPIPHMGSSAMPPMQRYIDQLRLAQSLTQTEEDIDQRRQQQQQQQRSQHLVPLPGGGLLPGSFQELLAPTAAGPYSLQHTSGSQISNSDESAGAGRRPRLSHSSAQHRNQQHASLPHQPHRQQQPPQQQAGGAQAAAAGGRRQGRASSAAVQLNKEIMAATTTTELLALVRTRGTHMDFFNISSAISRTPKLAGVQAFDGNNGPCGTSSQHPTLDADSRQLAAGLAELMCEHISQFDARGLANSAWAFGKLRFVPTPSLPALIASQAVAKIDGFCAQNISNLAWAFVYMHHRDERVLSVLARKICAKIDEFKPQELANVMWAFASLEYPDPDMMHVATQRAARIAPLFKEQELSNAIWAMGRLQFHNPQVFSTLLAVAASKLHLFLPQGIANIAWAMAALQHREPAMLARMASQCCGNLSAYDSQALCNLAWSLASLGYYDRALMEEVVSEGLQRLDRLSPHNLASLLWACAQLGHKDARMVAAWAQQVQVRLASFEPSAAAALVLSFHQLGCSDDALYASLAGVVAAKADACPTPELVGAAWALAASHSAAAAAPLLERLAARLGSPTALDSCGPRTSAMAMWSFAAQGQYPGAVAFESLLQRVTLAGDALEPGAAAQALWACARAGHAPGPQVQLLASRVLSLAPSMAPHELSDCAWALATLQLLDETSAHLLTTCLQQQQECEKAQAQQQGAARAGADAPAPVLQAPVPQRPVFAHSSAATAALPEAGDSVADAAAAAAALAELQQLMGGAQEGAPRSAVSAAAAAAAQQQQAAAVAQDAASAAAMWQWQQTLSGVPAPLLAAALLSKLSPGEVSAFDAPFGAGLGGVPLSMAEAAKGSAGEGAPASPASLLNGPGLAAEISEASSQQTCSPGESGQTAARRASAGMEAGEVSGPAAVQSFAAAAAAQQQQQVEALMQLPEWAVAMAAASVPQQQPSGWAVAPPAPRQGHAARAPLHMQHVALLNSWAAAAQRAGAGEALPLPLPRAQHHHLGGVVLAPAGSEDSLGAGWDAPELLLPRGLFSEGFEDLTSACSGGAAAGGVDAGAAAGGNGNIWAMMRG